MASLANNKFVILLLRVVLFLLLGTSVTLKLAYGLDYFETRLVATGFLPNWTSGIIIINVIIFLEILVGFGFLFDKKSVYLKSLSITLLMCYAISCFFPVQSDNYTHFTLCFFGPYWINILGLLGLTSLAFFWFKSELTDKKLAPAVLQFGLTILFLGILPFLLDSFQVNEFTKYSNSYAKGVSNWSSYDKHIATTLPDFENGNYLLAFFSVNCEHCNQAAKEIGISQRVFSNKKVVCVFWSETDEIEDFLNRNELSASYLKLSQSEIFNLSGPAFPVFYEIETGVPIKEYFGNTFNYATLDRIFSFTK